MYYIGDLFLNDEHSSKFYNHKTHRGYFFSHTNNLNILTYYVEHFPPGNKII